MDDHNDALPEHLSHHFISSDLQNVLEPTPIDFWAGTEVFILQCLEEGVETETIIALLMNHYPPSRIHDPSKRKEFCAWYLNRAIRKWKQYLDKYQTVKRGRPKALTPHGMAILLTLMKINPAACAYTQKEWSIALLQDALIRSCQIRVSDRTLRRVLQAKGFHWNGHKFVLDPIKQSTFPSCQQDLPFQEAWIEVREMDKATVIELVNKLPPLLDDSFSP